MVPDMGGNMPHSECPPASLIQMLKMEDAIHTH